MTRLVNGDAEPFPYTKVRDWIALLPQAVLSDGAFRCYYLSRSVVWEQCKNGSAASPVVEVTQEEYATILGRSPRTIARFAHELYALGLWEVIERTHRSVKIAGKARPEVRTVLTIRVRDYPQDLDTFDGPVKTWDVIAAIRDTKRVPPPEQITGGSADDASDREPDSHVDSAGGVAECALTPVSAQSDQHKHERAATSECDQTDLSCQSPAAPHEDQKHLLRPGDTPEPAGQCGLTAVTAAETNLSATPDVSAGQNTCGGAPKKKFKEEKPSLPPPSAAEPAADPAADPAALPAGQQVPSGRASLADELAMFSDEAVELVTLLYDKTLAGRGLQPLSASDRAGLARRVDARLTEGWSASRIRAVLTGGSLVGVKVPGRLWASRLDDMPAYPAVPRPRTAADDNAEDNADADGNAHKPAPPASGHPGRRSIVTNDCSTIPDPNAGKVRYQVPDNRGVRLVTRWADARRVLPWCGRCSSETRTLSPREAGQMPRACPDCHPEPTAFPPDPGPAPAPKPEPVPVPRAGEDT